MLRLGLLGAAVAAGAGGWWAWGTARPKPAPRAADRAGAFADNGREGAEYRWRTAQPRHWRHVVTARH